MSNQEQMLGGQIYLNKWPVSFSEWTDAYIVQILKQDIRLYTVKGKKDFREGLMDKLMLRMNLIFGTSAVYQNTKINIPDSWLSENIGEVEVSLLEEKAEIDLSLDETELLNLFEKLNGRSIWSASKSKFVLPEEVKFYLEEVWGKRQFEVWQKEKRREIFALARRCLKLKNEVDNLQKRLDKEKNHDKYLKLEKRLCIKNEQFIHMRKHGMELVMQFNYLDVADFLKVHMFETVSKYESEFYCILLDEIFSKRNTLTDLEGDKWWLIDIGTRERLLRCLEKLLKKKKWSFLEKDYYLLAMKLLRPHEYVLTKEITNLLHNVSALYSVGNSQTFCFFEGEGSDVIEVEYSDINHMKKTCTDAEQRLDSQQYEQTLGEKIAKLTEVVKELSEELGNYVEENGSNPQIIDELKKIAKVHCEKINQEVCSATKQLS